MNRLSLFIAMMTICVAGNAWAQAVNLTGVYRCVQSCRGGDVWGHVTQNGNELNLVTESGAASRAWPDWFAPTNRIWIDALDQSAVYTPDGMVIQFDDGTIWVRDPGPRPPRYRK